MARPKITLYVDTVSPFAYQAYYLLRHDPIFKKCDITYVPIFLGGLMQKCGNTPPIRIKNKDKWINTERLRWASHFSIPITDSLPPNFPPLTLPIMRALCAIPSSSSPSPPSSSSSPQPEPEPEPSPGAEHETPQQQATLTLALDALYKAYWVDRLPTFEPDTLGQVLQSLSSATDNGGGGGGGGGNSSGGGGGGGGNSGLTEATINHMLAGASTQPAKQRLMHNTDRAFADGAFGLPWMTCTDAAGRTEGFFGVDHLGQVVRFLGLGDAGDLAKTAGGGGGNNGWKSVL